MDIRSALESEHSKAKTMEIVHHIGNSPKRFGEVVALVTAGEPPFAQRGAWVISHCAEAEPGAVQPHLKTLLEHLRQSDSLHDAAKRNTMKAASILEIPDDIAGLAADLAFGYLASPTEPVAVKVYSMSVLHHLAEREPVLADELRLHLGQPVAGSDKPAFRSRARSVLAALDRGSPCRPGFQPGQDHPDAIG